MFEAPTDTKDWSRERLLRVLMDPVFGAPAGRSLNQIAKEADVAYGWSHKIWTDLIEVGAFQDIKSPRITDVTAAFSYWLHHRPPMVHADYHVLDGLNFLKSIEHDRSLEYVATTYLAENMVQGHLFPRRFDLYIRTAQQKNWHAALSSRGFSIDSPANDKGTIRLLAADEGIVKEAAPLQPAPLPPQDPVRGIWTVRMPVLIVDLLAEGGPCVEAAEKLMEKTYA